MNVPSGAGFVFSGKKSLTIFLQVVLVVLGISAIVFMLWEPHLEGRNVHATPFEIYFKDPFLAYAYIGSISFFVALYKIFRVVGYVRENKVFSQEAAKALRTIKYCAITLVGFVVAPLVYLFIVRPDNDIAGGVAMGLFIILVSIVTAVTAAVFERRVKNAVRAKSENDLMV